MRYGIDMPQEYGYREIADQLDLSRERVRQIELELVRKLRRTTSA
jgi:DNA-directed RNA polymerase sigma subunit (sigma70/sigma32)